MGPVVPTRGCRRGRRRQGRRVAVAGHRARRTAPEPPAGSRGGDLPPGGPVVVVRSRRRDGKRWPALNFRVRGGSRASGEWRHCATSEREGRRVGSERYAPATFLSRRTARRGSVRARGGMNGMGGANEAARSSIRSRARARGGGTSRKSVHAKGLARGGADEDHDGRIDNQVRRPGGPAGIATTLRDAPRDAPETPSTPHVGTPLGPRGRAHARARHLTREHVPLADDLAG